ncbi:hypothetical protein H8D91_02045 [archaeon]|nr:hypothetical protein [archaeon]
MLYPIGLIIFGKLRIKGLLKKYWLLVISLSLVVVSRLWNFAKHTGPVALYLTGSNENYLSTLFVRLLYYPFVSLSQTLVPAQYLIPLSRRLTDIFFPSYEGVNYLVMAETTVLDMVSTLLSFFVLIIIFLVYRKVKTNTKKELLFFLTFTFLSFIPYIIVKKSFSYLDSRFYYLGVLGMSSILSTVLKFFKLHKNMIIYSLAFFLIVPHALIVRGELNKIVQVSKERKNIIVSFENIIKNQKNKNKVVFYLDGDTDYYLPGHKVPFQGGIGYIFMVLSSNYLEIQENLFVDEYLFEIGSQGYKNEYGYFSDIGMLNEHIRKGNFKTSDIVFLKYFGGEQKLLDETTK